MPSVSKFKSKCIGYSVFISPIHRVPRAYVQCLEGRAVSVSYSVYRPKCLHGFVSCKFHAAKIGDCCVFVRIGIQQHLSVGVKGQVGPNALPVFPKEVSHSLHFRLRFWERTTVCVIARVCGGPFLAPFHLPVTIGVNSAAAKPGVS